MYRQYRLLTPVSLPGVGMLGCHGPGSTWVDYPTARRGKDRLEFRYRQNNQLPIHSSNLHGSTYFHPGAIIKTVSMFAILVTPIYGMMTGFVRS